MANAFAAAKGGNPSQRCSHGAYDEPLISMNGNFSSWISTGILKKQRRISANTVYRSTKRLQCSWIQWRRQDRIQITRSKKNATSRSACPCLGDYSRSAIPTGLERFVSSLHAASPAVRENCMKKSKDEMRPEYTRSDFKRLERGKFYAEAAKGTTVVLLEPAIAKAFPSSEAVNEALYSLLALTEKTARLTRRSSKRTKTIR